MGHRGDDDVVGFWLAVDGVVDVGGFTFGEGNVDAKGCEGFLDQWGAVLDPVVVGAQEVEAGKAGFSEQRLGVVGVEGVDRGCLVVVGVFLLHEGGGWGCLVGHAVLTILSMSSA